MINCQKACEVWSNRYDYSLKSAKHLDNIETESTNKLDLTHQPNNVISDPAVLDTVKEFIHEAANLNLIEDENAVLEHLLSSDNNNDDCSKKQLDSLQSLGDSSGYESFKYKPDDCFLNASGQIDDQGKFSDGHKEASCLSEEEKEVKANIMFSSGGDSDLVDPNCIGT